jgi:hypothetical protein
MKTAGKEREVPKLIFAAATTWFSKPSRPRTAQEAHAELTRSRDATRRLRASRSHEAWFELSPLDLARRH